MMHGELQRAPAIGVLAVVVLYKLSPRQSPAFQSLVQAAGQQPGLSLVCVVYDNSPAPHELPETPFPCTYCHDPSNPGLAVAYQYALNQAEREELSWLLLLDQDTIVTVEYLKEALQVVHALQGRGDVGAIVPKLVQDGAVLSPHWPSRIRSRQKFDNLFGLIKPTICVYNSGALLRVEAVRAANGFPLEYPLDYLDHAMFAQLQARQQGVFLMRAALPHQLESKSQDMHVALGNSPRLQAMLAAETRFYRQYGVRQDHLMLLRRRAKLALVMLLRLKVHSLAALVRSTFC